MPVGGGLPVSRPRCELRSARRILVSRQSPPFGDGEIVVRGGVAPKVQTNSAKNAENGLLWAKWSAFWAQWCQSVPSCGIEKCQVVGVPQTIRPNDASSPPRNAKQRQRKSVLGSRLRQTLIMCRNEGNPTGPTLELLR